MATMVYSLKEIENIAWTNKFTLSAETIEESMLNKVI